MVLCWLNNGAFRRFVEAREDGNISPFRYGDEDRIILASEQIIMFKCAPDPAGFYPNDRIILGIECRIAAENLKRYRVGLDPVSAALQGFFDHIT